MPERQENETKLRYIKIWLSIKLSKKPIYWRGQRLWIYAIERQWDNTDILAVTISEV